ncbi:MAG: tRNA (guanosine(37)-N1)-methyltransferase TrmD [Armatimonadetes bacterium]|nr:tRNA (guanosine(37)-N1)-methyltransferase TrmD [Armatimonadota bacterium]
MRFDVLTTFPEMFDAPLGSSIMGRARESGLVECLVHNIRDWTRDRHRTTDDYPFGGGVGMVMKPEPVCDAVRDLRSEGPRGVVILTTPQGEVLDHRVVQELAAEERLILLCGHYEGVDERVSELVVDREISIGDYVLTGGELPALIIMDAVIRFVPGVLGAEESAQTDSFAWDGLLDCPHYTRPREYEGLSAPEVLFSGNHGKIAKWRRSQAILRTAARRPDLLAEAQLSDEERALAETVLRQERD